MNHYDKETLIEIITSQALELTKLRQQLKFEHDLGDHVIQENYELREKMKKMTEES